MARPEPKRKRLPNTAANRSEIIDRIEKKLGPVGPGHHNAHRTAHLREWLASSAKKAS